ncbi:MAG: PepSY domain-containing protein [Myxococcota bacterium]
MTPDTMARPPARDRARAARNAKILKIIRRTHLYAGLAMVPWVLMYAISGLLFNHPSLSGSPGVHRFVRDDLPPQVLADVPTPESAAEAAVEAMRATAPDAQIELQPTPLPEYGGSLRARGEIDDQRVRLFLGARSGNGSLRMSPVEEPAQPEAFAEVESMPVDALEPAIFERMVEAAAEPWLDEPEALKLESAPKIEFVATIDGRPWRVTYDAVTQKPEFEEIEEPEVRTSRILARLHMTHTYPAEFGVPWIHAFVVDLTIFCLIMWSITGVVMWWQLRRLRRVGWVVMLSGVVASIWMLALVWPALVG